MVWFRAADYKVFARPYAISLPCKSKEGLF